MDSVSSVFMLMRLAVSSDIGERRACVLSVCLEIGGIGLVTVSPLLLKQLIDTVGHRGPETAGLWLLLAAFVATWAGSGLVSSLRATQSARMTAGLGRYLTTGALQAALPLSVRQRQSDSSRLLGLLERLPFSLAIIMDGLVWSSLPLLLQLIISLAVAAAVLPVIEIIVLAGLLFAFAVVSFLGAVRHQSVAQASNAAASQASHLLGDVIRNSRRVVLNGNLDGEVRHVDGVLIDKAGKSIASAWSLARMSALQFATLTVGLLLLLGLAVRALQQGHMTVGGLVLLQAYAMRMVLPLGSFGFIFSHAGEALANVSEVFKMQGTVHRREAMPAVRAPSPAWIQVKALTFHYGEEGPGVDGVSVDFPPGSVTAIVGANGSGKSTFAQLLAGIFPPEGGTITVNGVDLETIDPSHRHGWILYVPQSVGLFNRSLEDNARYPPTDISPEDLQARLTSWGFYDSNRLIDLTTPVGEQGEKLSGGQIQKLELARISGVRSAMLILDESTSALDPAAEVRVIEDLRKTFVGRTSLVLITHRPAAAAIADQVIWLARGRVAAIGDHEQLMRSEPAYARLWNAEAD